MQRDSRKCLFDMLDSCRLLEAEVESLLKELGLSP